MAEYPNNSYNAREKKPEGSGPPDKKLEKVVSGGTKTRKVVVSLIGSPGAFVVPSAQAARFAKKHDTDCVSDCVLDAGNDDIN